jgi:hypothetical protein
VGKWGDADPLGSWLLNATYADYDARKLDRLLQESTGQTAVTASADKVGLWLDGSRFGGKTLAQVIAQATEEIDNPTFANGGSGWTATNSTPVYGAGQVAVTATAGFGFVETNPGAPAGWYEFTVPVLSLTGGTSAAINVVDSNGTTYGGGTLRTTPGTLKFTFYSPFSIPRILLRSSLSGTTVTFGAPSLHAIPGNHGSQATSTQRLNLLISGSRYTLTADGTDDNLLSTYLAGSGANSILLDIDVPATLSASQVVLGMSGSATARLSLGINTSGQLCAGVGSDANTTIVGTTDWRGTRLIAALSTDGSTVKLLSATGEEYSAAQNGSPTTTIPARLAANNNNGTASSFFGGGAARIIAAQKALDLATFNAIRNQLLAS